MIRVLARAGIGLRLGALVSALLLIVMLVGVFGFVAERGQTAFRLFTFNLTNRVAATVSLVEAADGPEIAGLLQAINSPSMRVLPLFDERAANRLLGSDALEEEDFHPGRILVDRVRSRLPALRARDLQLRYIVEEHGHRRLEEDAWRGRRTDPLAAPDLLPSQRKLLLYVPLTDGREPIRDRNGGISEGERHWTPIGLAFIVSLDTTSFAWVARTVLWLLLGGGLLVGITLWATWRATRPLAQFTAAAERLGVDVEAAPLPETGSKELRHATKAFNTMADRLRRFVRDRTQMIAAISHDLRTILTRLRLRAEFIEDEDQRARALDDLDTMTEMLNATLAFARDDRKQEKRSAVDLSLLLQSLLDDRTDQGQTATYSGPSRLVVMGQPVGLKRVFDNLIENAVAYGTQADVILEQEDDRILVHVQDGGPGIPSDRREAVFAPFHRLEVSRNRETGGTGLGLTVARGIVRAHGGDILLSDGDAGGLRATVSLPSELLTDGNAPKAG